MAEINGNFNCDSGDLYNNFNLGAGQGQMMNPPTSCAELSSDRQRIAYQQQLNNNYRLENNPPFNGAYFQSQPDSVHPVSSHDNSNAIMDSVLTKLNRIDALIDLWSLFKVKIEESEKRLAAWMDAHNEEIKNRLENLEEIVAHGMADLGHISLPVSSGITISPPTSPQVIAGAASPLSSRQQTSSSTVFAKKQNVKNENQGGRRKADDKEIVIGKASSGDGSFQVVLVLPKGNNASENQISPCDFRNDCIVEREGSSHPQDSKEPQPGTSKESRKDNSQPTPTFGIPEQNQVSLDITANSGAGSRPIPKRKMVSEDPRKSRRSSSALASMVAETMVQQVRSDASGEARRSKRVRRSLHPWEPASAEFPEAAGDNPLKQERVAHAKDDNVSINVHKCICGYQGASYEAVYSHVKYNGTVDPRYKCQQPACPKRFLFPSILRNHLANDHRISKVPKFTCKKCYRLFHTLTIRDTHKNARNEICIENPRRVPKSTLANRSQRSSVARPVAALTTGEPAVAPPAPKQGSYNAASSSIELIQL